jgi:hypothetical protein
MTGANNASLPISKSIHKTNPTMKTIPTLLMAFSALLPLVLAALWSPLVAAETRPNVVMILTDDQRHDAAGFTGNTAIHTPNLDRLAKAGLIFNNCFVNTSICASTAPISWPVNTRRVMALTISSRPSPPTN